MALLTFLGLSLTTTLASPGCFHRDHTLPSPAWILAVACCLPSLLSPPPDNLTDLPALLIALLVTSFLLPGELDDWAEGKERKMERRRERKEERQKLERIRKGRRDLEA
jgi:hypothetical protein